MHSVSPTLDAYTPRVSTGAGVGATAFRWEQEMVPALVAAADGLVRNRGPEPVRVLTEVASAVGVPDLVAIRFDESATIERLDAGLLPVVDLTQVRSLVAAAGGARSVVQLAHAAGVTPSYMRRSVLPALMEIGWLESPMGRGQRADVVPRHSIRSIAFDLITVEAKKSAWQRAVNQAMRHASSSDNSYIALDATRAAPAIEQRAAIRRLGVGLLTVDPETYKVKLVTRAPNRPSDPAMRMLLAERAWQLALAGKSAGPTFPVFGRDLAPELTGLSR